MGVYEGRRPYLHMCVRLVLVYQVTQDSSSVVEACGALTGS